MSRLSNFNSARQRGDSLLESLIGILLMSIIGLGIIYIASRAAVSQRNMKLQNIVVSQMRTLLEQNGTSLCTTSAALAVVSIPTQTSPLPIVATCVSASAVTVGTSSIPGGAIQGSVVLTTRTQDTHIFGGIIRVGDET